jgi:peroxiredoxin Q/BCP
MNSQKFPDFSLKGHDEKTYTLNDFSGQKVVFYFYPKDDTSGCTLEANQFKARSKEFEAVNTKIVGISPDSGESHCKFMEKYGLNFLLLSDPEKELIEELGLWVEKSMYGKKYFGVERTTYLVDENGMVLKIWNKVTPEGHAVEVLEYIKGL